MNQRQGPSSAADEGEATRAPRGLGGAACVAALGGLSAGVAWLAGRPFVEDLGAWAAAPAAATHHWAAAGARWLFVAAAALAVLWSARVGRFLSRRRATDVVSRAAAQALQVPRARVRLRRAKWRKGRLVRCHVCYRPAHAVVQDLGGNLQAALRTHLAGPATVRWVRRRARFVVAPRGMRLEEQHAAVQKLAEALSHIVGELKVDQRQTSVGPDGSVQRFVATYRHTTRDIGEGFRRRIQTVLDAKAPSPTGYWSVSWAPSANEVELVPAPPLPTLARYPLDQPDPDGQLRIPLGVGEGGKLVYWRPDKMPHMMLVGPTGTGKTIFLFSLLVSCLARGWRVVLLDPKELSFRGFDPAVLRQRGLQEWPGIELLATSEPAMEQGLSWSYDLMRDRYVALKNFQVREQDLRPTLAVVDETGELAERLNEYQQSPEKKAEAEAAGRKAVGSKNPELRKLWSGLRLGRQGRVYYVIATQRPDVTFIPGEARSNLTCRAGLGYLEGQALEMVFTTRSVQQRASELVTDPATGQRARKRIDGRATVDVGGGPQTIQTFWVPDPAKLITGELGAEDISAVQALQQLVLASRPRWDWQIDAPAAGETDRRGADRALAAEPTPDEQADPEGAQDAGDRTVYGRDLEPGMQVLMVIDGKETAVEIEDIAPDPDDEDDLLEITYRQEDLPAVTSVARGEEFTLLPT